MELPATCKYI